LRKVFTKKGNQITNLAGRKTTLGGKAKRMTLEKKV